MVKKALWAFLLLSAGASLACENEPDPNASRLQGVVEFDVRQLGFEIGGRVQDVSVVEGDSVKKGEVLASLDASLETLAREGRERDTEVAKAEVALLRAGSRPEEIRSAAAQLSAAKSHEALVDTELKRERALVERGVTPQAAADKLEAELARAKAERRSLQNQVSLLQKGARKEEIERAALRVDALSSAVELESARLARHELRSGLDGFVLDVAIEPNEIVAPGTTVVTVADTSRPYADVFVPQADLAGIEVGRPAHVYVDFAAEPWPAHVEYVAQEVEFTPRFLFSPRERPNLVVRVRVRIDDPKRRLFAGIPAFVEVDRAAP